MWLDLLSPGRLAVLSKTGSARRARRPVAMTLICRLQTRKCRESAQPPRHSEWSCIRHNLRVFKAFVRLHPFLVVDAGIEADQDRAKRKTLSGGESRERLDEVDRKPLRKDLHDGVQPVETI